MNPSFDSVATDVVTASSPNQVAARFEGWVGPLAPDGLTTGPVFRLFTNAQLSSWLEIARDDLLHQISPTSQDPEGSSTIWIKREAIVKKCRSGAAYLFEDQTLDDPTAISPRPTKG